MEEKKEISKKAPRSKKLPPQGNWRKKLRDKEEMLKYIKTAGRYWYSKDWYGSEKRKTSA